MNDQFLEKRQVTLELPEDFITVSELFNITVERTLECFIQHITIYDFFARETERPESRASKLFGKYLKSRMTSKEKIEGKDPSYHVPFIQTIMALIKEEQGFKSAAYKACINEWHKEMKLKKAINEKDN